MRWAARLRVLQSLRSTGGARCSQSRQGGNGSAAAASWPPEIVAFERVAEAVTTLATESVASEVRPDARSVDVVCSALNDLADAAIDSRTIGRKSSSRSGPSMLSPASSRTRAPPSSNSRGARRRGTPRPRTRGGPPLGRLSCVAGCVAGDPPGDVREVRGTRAGPYIRNDLARTCPGCSSDSIRRFPRRRRMRGRSS